VSRAEQYPLAGGASQGHHVRVDPDSCQISSAYEIFSCLYSVSPGRGFGEWGDDYVRFALVENVHRTNQAIRGFRKMLKMPEEEIKVKAREMEQEFAKELALFAVER
jgi:hypothetical protein